MRTSSRLDCFFFTVQPMAPRQLPMPSVADSDDLLGSLPCSLPCLSANGLTARPYGNTIQALYFTALHSVTHVPFFSSDIVSASIPSSLAPFAS